MRTNTILKLILIIVVIILFGAYAAPTFIGNNTSKSLPSYVPKDKIHLGLDLKGGMYLVLGAETDKAVSTVLERAASNLKKQMLNAKIAYDKVFVTKDGKYISVSLVDSNDRQAALDLIRDNLPNYNVISEELPIKLSMKEKIADTIKKESVSQAISVIRNRIDQFGVVDPTIVRSGESNIIVELPGIKNASRAVQLIGKTARLELHLVDDSANVNDALNGKLTLDDELLYSIKRDPTTGSVSKIPYVVKKNAIITGDMIKKAYVSFGGQLNQPYVAFELNSEGAKIFGNFTGSHIGKRLAIVLDKNIYSAPVIQGRIDGGRGQITGNFSEREAHDLAIILRSGSLPVPVHVLEKVTIGPSLGKIAIEKGTKAMIAGAVAVILFMAVYYALSGILADIALSVNIIIILGALAMFGGTLTLPGLAGIALSIGMAVDANVLIYERIREEMRVGRGIHDAINTGYSRAFITILDANITTLIIALILYQFGSGPVKGFAVTMSIGLLANIFTAVTLTKTVYDILIEKFNISKLSI